MTTNGQKAGPWSKEDKAYIAKQAGKISPEDIAVHLKRNPEAVKNYMGKQGLLKYYSKKDVDILDNVLEIENSHHWPILCQKFSPAELESFKYHWKNMIKQFKDDIFHTEELQIIDMITLEILIDRKLIDCQKIKEKIEFLEKEIIKAKKASPPDPEVINDYERELAGWYASTEAITKDHMMLLKEKQNLLHKLKATREQRIKDVDSSKTSFSGWMKELLKNNQLRIDLGLKIEKMRLATKVEYERLSEFNKFEDGDIDQMVLNADNVK